MSEVRTAMRDRDANRHEGGTTASRSAAAWLSLAASPAFAIMALLTASDGVPAADLLCSASPDASPLSGMTAMYVLMSIFHSVSWLKLISSSRAGGEAAR
jgi:hypothetical protein